MRFQKYLDLTAQNARISDDFKTKQEELLKIEAILEPLKAFSNLEPQIDEKVIKQIKYILNND